MAKANDRGYELIDAGDGRRLERFGDRVVDRPTPTAVEPRRDPGAWTTADLLFERGRGWQGSPSAVEPWFLTVHGVTLELRPTASGQVGWFPEHAAVWPWLRDSLRERAGLQVLNLFAYTGAATLVLARDGAGVAHVDGSRPSVAWARRNAEASGLAGAPIRWIVDDAQSFAARESRRGRIYDGIVLDPPSYGHGRGRGWRLEDRLPALLDACAAVLSPGPSFVVLTAHTLSRGAVALAGGLEVALEGRRGVIESGDLTLVARSGAILPLGAWARWRSAGR